MNKKLVLLGTALLLTAASASAQKRVTGRVVDNDGQPVVGATVRVEGHKGVTTTDADGRFVLPNVSASAKHLKVTYIGKKDQTVSISSNVKVTLADNDQVLDEAMVIAYGTQKKSAFTGSAAVVGSEEIGKVQVTNAVDALKGKAAGVQINTASGQPGATPTIRIRGVNSINAGNAPLIVVDGSPFDGSLNDINPADVESETVLKDAASTALYGARGGNGVILITTKSAKLKQPAVITVDAKWGSNSKAVPEYRTISSPAKYYEMWYKGLYNYATQIDFNKHPELTSDEDKIKYNGKEMDPAAAYQWAASDAILINSADYGLGYNVYTVPTGQYLIGQNGKLNPNAMLGRTVSYNGTDYYLTPDNWIDETYHNSLRQEYTVTATGGNGDGTFYTSFNYLKNEGIVKASDYERLTYRLKADYQLKPWLKLGGNMSYGHYTQNQLGDEGSSSSSGNPFAFSNIAPIYPMYIRDAQGNFIYDPNSRLIRYDYGDKTSVGLVRPFLSQSNPVSDIQLNTRENEGNTFNGTGTAEVRLPYDFTVTSINNVYLHEYRRTLTTNPYYGQYASLGGQVDKYHYRNWSYNLQQRVNWRHSFGLHNVEAMVGHEYYRFYSYMLYGNKTNQFSVDNKELAGAVVAGSATSYTTDYNTESWLARAMYNYGEKYFASASVVREASSHFDPDHRWGTFWSVGGGWLINKESWFNAPWVDELKLKASYGENGNDAIGGYQYTTYYNITNSNDEVSLVPSSLGNREISWEKNAKFNVGFDFSLFGGRLTGSVEYYANKTKDMLTWFPLPASYGYSGYYDNVGNMLNNGVEIDLHGDIIRTKDLTWSAYVNLTSNHNEITSLPDEKKTSQCDGVDGYQSGSFFYGEGISRYTYHTKRYAGVDPETGVALYYKNVYKKDETTGENAKDANGHYIVEKVEKTVSYGEASDYLCGDMLPDVYGGFGTSVTWKGFDLSVDFQYQLGGQVYDGTYASLMTLDAGHGLHVDMLGSWSTENTSSNIPRMQYGDSYTAASSDRFLTSASYLSLSNVTIGYTLPKSITSKIGIKSLRIYGVADNVWLWSKRQGLDPRLSISGGGNNTYYKPIRTISGGITLTF